jgi:hypothetical protein
LSRYQQLVELWGASLRYQRPQRKIEEVERNLGAVVGMIVIVLVARDRGKERKAGAWA